MELQEFYDQYKWFIAMIIIWELAWKGLALWTAARSNERNWFIALLIINTVGLLPIFYLTVLKPQNK